MDGSFIFYISGQQIVNFQQFIFFPFNYCFWKWLGFNSSLSKTTTNCRKLTIYAAWTYAAIKTSMNFGLEMERPIRIMEQRYNNANYMLSLYMSIYILHIINLIITINISLGSIIILQHPKIIIVSITIQTKEKMYVLRTDGIELKNKIQNLYVFELISLICIYVKS